MYGFASRYATGKNVHNCSELTPHLTRFIHTTRRVKQLIQQAPTRRSPAVSRLKRLHGKQTVPNWVQQVQQLEEHAERINEILKNAQLPTIAHNYGVEQLSHTIEGKRLNSKELLLISNRIDRAADQVRERRQTINPYWLWPTGCLIA